jgi:hypothetical protein
MAEEKRCSIYDEKLFAEVPLSPETERLLGRRENAAEWELVQLNRHLLDDAFEQAKEKGESRSAGESLEIIRPVQPLSADEAAQLKDCDSIGKRLERARFSDVVNQMIHRAASACYQTSKSPVLIYQSFETSDKARPERMDDLRLFYELLGRPAALPFYFFRVSMQCTEVFLETLSQLETPQALRAEIIRAAIFDKDLFAFGQPELLRV